MVVFLALLLPTMTNAMTYQRTTSRFPNTRNNNNHPISSVSYPKWRSEHNFFTSVGNKRPAFYGPGGSNCYSNIDMTDQLVKAPTVPQHVASPPSLSSEGSPPSCATQTQASSSMSLFSNLQSISFPGQEIVTQMGWLMASMTVLRLLNAFGKLLGMDLGIDYAVVITPTGSLALQPTMRVVNNPTASATIAIPANTSTSRVQTSASVNDSESVEETIND